MDAATSMDIQGSFSYHPSANPPTAPARLHHSTSLRNLAITAR